MFFILFVLRVPAAFTMALVGFLGIACVTSPEAAFAMIGSEMWTLFSNYGLTVIPLFILVGEIVHYAGYNHVGLPGGRPVSVNSAGNFTGFAIVVLWTFSAISGS